MRRELKITVEKSRPQVRKRKVSRIDDEHVFYLKHDPKESQIYKIRSMLKQISSSSNRQKALFLAFATAYFFNPLDVIPDLAPFIGYLDDVLVCTTAIECIRTSIPFKEFRNQIELKLKNIRRGGKKHGNK